MQKHTALTGWMVLMLSVAGAGVTGAAAGSDFNLVPDITWDEAAVYPGAEVAVAVKYTVNGPEAIPVDAVVKFHLELRALNAAPEEALSPARQSEEMTVTTAPGKKSGDTFLVNATIVAPPEGTYTLVTVLTVNDIPIEHTTPFGVQSALPPGLTRLLAGLGMFVAIMAIMAAGTEVVIDAVKVCLGLKQKITALEAFDQLRDQLPGQLTNLGVRAEAQKQMQELLVNLATAWQPAINIQQLQAGEFKEFFTAIEKSVDENTAKAEARQIIQRVLDRVGPHFHLTPEQRSSFETQLAQAIDSISFKTAAEYATTLATHVAQAISNNGPAWVQQWLVAQADLYLTKGQAEVTSALEKTLDMFAALGIAPDSVNQLQQEASKRLPAIMSLFHDQTLTYSLAVQKLLEAVQDRRGETQSPARKFWRSVKQPDSLFIIVLVGSFAVSTIAVFVLGLWVDALVALAVAFPLLGFVFLGLVEKFQQWQPVAERSFVMMVVVVVILLFADMNRMLILPFALFWVLFIVWFAADLQRYPAAQAPSQLTPSRSEVGPTTVAATLLAQDDQHQDEEASRIRWLRVISILVGTVLAYLLQIDALLILEEALPGAVKGNVALLTVAQLQAWSLWFTHDLTAGIIITGLAASAGSKFWRDLLGQLEATKAQAEATAGFVRKTKKTLGLENQP